VGRFLGHWARLAGLFGALVLVGATWVSLDRRPPEWDHANHLERAVHCRQLLSEQGSGGLREIFAMSSFYPPLVPCATALLYGLFPVTPLAAQSVMLGFLGLALVSLFVLGRRLFDPGTGLLAALLFGTAPFVVFSGTNFQLDLPLAAMVSFALLALVRTEGFSARGWSLVAGIAWGLGMLTKPPFALYVLPPVVLTAWRGLREEAPRRRLANLALAVLVGGATALPWYGPRLFGLSSQVLARAYKQAAESEIPELFSSASLLFYPRTFLPQFGLLAGLLFLWGLWAIARDRAARGLLWSASVVPFGLLLLIQNRNLRYTLPLLPAVALLAARGLTSLPSAWRPPARAAVLGVALLQVGAVAFGIPPVPRWSPFVGVPLVISNPPRRATWPHQEILARIVGESRGAPTTVAVVPNDNFFSVSNFRYYAVRERLPLTLSRAWDLSPIGVEFIVTKTGDQGPAFSIAKARRIMERLARGDPAFERVFPVIAEYPLPDGSRGLLRKRVLAPVDGIAPSTLARHLEGALERWLALYARDVRGFAIRLDYAPEALLAGRIERATLEAREALLGEFSRKPAALRVRDLRLAVGDVVFNPHRVLASDEIELLGLGSLRIDSLVIHEADLRSFLRPLRGLGGLSLRLEDGAATVELRQPGPDLSGRLGIVAGEGGAAFRLRVEELRLGPLRLPPLLADWVFRHYDPSARIARLPVGLELGTIRIAAGRIEVGRLDGRRPARLE
jgi:hypothetical protein